MILHFICKITKKRVQKHKKVRKFYFFLKKVDEKFGGFKKTLYLCTRKQGTIILECGNGGSVAQLNRASDYGSEGCGFESRRNH